MTSEITNHEADNQSITIHVTTAGKVNLALQQNSVPMLREIMLSNPTDVDYQDLGLPLFTTRNLL